MVRDKQPAHVGAEFVDTVTCCHFTVRAVGRAGVTGTRVIPGHVGASRLYSWREWFSRCRVVSEAH